jgi:hypothetical protein
MPRVITRSPLSRADIGWMIGIALIAITVNPILKYIGLLPADVFRSYEIMYPGLPQVVFGPLIAFLLLVCFIKTGEPLIFPVIGILRALSLGFVAPANIEHLGTGLGGILAGFIAAALVKNADRINLARWLPLLAGLYAGFSAAGNYLTTLTFGYFTALSFGAAAQSQIILSDLPRTLGVVVGSLVIGLALGVVGYWLARFLPQRRLATNRPSAAF